MIGREYEQYLISEASSKQESFSFGFLFVIMGIGFIFPLIGFILNN
ncbi:hypothetical protein JCM14036_28970 [Desulfotomaculum defluvii]